MEWAADKLSDKWWSEESEGTDKLEETVRDCHSQLQPRVGGPGHRDCHWVRDGLPATGHVSPSPDPCAILVSEISNQIRDNTNGLRSEARNQRDQEGNDW